VTPVDIYKMHTQLYIHLLAQELVKIRLNNNNNNNNNTEGYL